MTSTCRHRCCAPVFCALTPAKYVSPCLPSYLVLPGTIRHVGSSGTFPPPRYPNSSLVRRAASPEPGEVVLRTARTDHNGLRVTRARSAPRRLALWGREHVLTASGVTGASRLGSESTMHRSRRPAAGLEGEPPWQRIGIPSPASCPPTSWNG